MESGSVCFAHEEPRCDRLSHLKASHHGLLHIYTDRSAKLPLLIVITRLSLPDRPNSRKTRAATGWQRSERSAVVRDEWSGRPSCGRRRAHCGFDRRKVRQYSPGDPTHSRYMRLAARCRNIALAHIPRKQLEGVCRKHIISVCSPIFIIARA